MLRLQPYNFRVIDKKGSLNEADYLSRHPITSQNKDTKEGTVAENCVNFLIQHAIPKKMTLQKIREARKKELTLIKVKENILSGK